MTDRDDETVSCPMCDSAMTNGWVAMWNALPGQKIRWQKTKPSYRRLHVPAGAAIVLKARVGRSDARIAYRCSNCSATVIPRDESYDS